ncbi:hypothetical protein SAMN02745163_01934 [Clostridium cavendishii DSM 21758]|uniref:Phosphatidylglycerol lysyltransferase C-terminal domain-containing protein n=1 Tax=Clostridium cavendishii DSM 21758 TaxID=1121302 RepID=A0A1M6J746_9CLOT|nr:phosphatidylglycerol lysyltransferase domain-containing protein [Clostridium cavendishii]SHJ42512.1 hypothetical protein SAMN02745163_01934 [Clostridium cavendishii DSM 21758]
MFKKLELCDKNVFDSFLTDYPFFIYDYSFTNLYLWKDLCGIEYNIIYDCLVIKVTNSEIGPCFMAPVSKEPLDDLALKKIVTFLASINSNPYLFVTIDTNFSERLKKIFKEELHIEADLDNFDYIYNGNKLKTLKGKKLSKKRNHYNKFKTSYNYELKSIDDQLTICDVLAFSDTWYNKKSNKTKELVYENNAIGNLLINKNALNLDALALYVDNKVVGFTIGEKVSKDMAIIHVEKCDIEYDGSYTFLNKNFIEMFYPDIPYINREEDMGLPGLRKAKLSYYPERLEKKYFASLKI